MNVMTWNTQGAGTEGNPKAKLAVLADGLMSRPAVAAEQERGSVPDQLPGTAIFA